MNHLIDLMLKSQLAVHTPDNNQSKYNNKIAKAYEELNGIKLIEPILKVASTSDELKIIFDYLRFCRER